MFAQLNLLFLELYLCCSRRWPPRAYPPQWPKLPKLPQSRKCPALCVMYSCLCMKMLFFLFIIFIMWNSISSLAAWYCSAKLKTPSWVRCQNHTLDKNHNGTDIWFDFFLKTYLTTFPVLFASLLRRSIKRYMEPFTSMVLSYSTNKGAIWCNNILKQAGLSCAKLERVLTLATRLGYSDFSKTASESYEL